MQRIIVSSLTSLIFVFWLWIEQAPAAGYTQAQIISIAKELGKKQNMLPDKLQDLMKNLKKALKTSQFKEMVKSQPVNAVFVFHAGEGGLLVKFMTGEGLISFESGKQAANIHLRSWSAGAQIGGSAVWGIGLVMGLKNISHFGGDYTGKIKSATAADETTVNGAVLSLSDCEDEKKCHDIYVVHSARGLSAEVGWAKMTIAPGW